MKPNKRVFVSGSSRGIGEAVARRFAREGCEVLLHANQSVARAENLANEIGARLFVCDFTKREDVTLLAEQIGEVDVLVNCAGISDVGLFQDCDDEELSRLTEVNLCAPMRLTRALMLPMIRKKQGAIVNVSSVWGQTGASTEVAYSATKAGLIGFTKALAKELAPSGVRVNCVCPGAIDTDMMASFSAEERAALCEEIPLMRLGTAAEVAECVYFLASESASYVTGQILAPNGGLYI